MRVIPAKLVLDSDRGAGIHGIRRNAWIPAYAGMTERCFSTLSIYVID